MSLPKDFLIGAATAAHQVEGNNIHSDCWAQEHMEFTSFVEPSGNACDHYNRFEEDIKLLADAGLNAYRFSIEWARIEPEEGKFDEAEVEHYRQVLKCCKAHGVEPVATLMHFTSPKWLIEQGGWEKPETVDKFARYCRFVTERLGDWMDYVCTINEVNMGLQLAAIAERYKKMMMQNAAKAQSQVESSVQVGVNLENPMMERMKKQAMENVQVFGTPQPQTFVSSRTPDGDILVMKAHQAAKAVIKEVKPDLKVGLSLSLHDIQPVDGGDERAAAEWAEEFAHYLPYIQDDDFFGLQNYTRTLMGSDGQLPNPEGAEVTQMGYEFYPQALENVIRKVHESLSIPIIVTENGIATAEDTRRVAFIKTALSGVEKCVNDGIPVKGYFYWSLMDNFEWQKGFAMQFGLIAVDRETQTRSPKESLNYLGSWR